MSAPARRALVLLLALSTIGCDRVTKHLAQAALQGEPARAYLSGTVRLEYVENPGGFLSLGAQLPGPARFVVFVLGTAAILVASIAVALRRHLPLQPLLALTLVVAGGASNLLDRVLRGSVVDFVHVGIGGWRTGIFNAADLAVALGALWMLRHSTLDDAEAPADGRGR